MSRQIKTPLSRRPLVFIDTETTGLNPIVHEVIEVAIIREEAPWISWVKPLTDVWHTKIKPEHPEVNEPEAYASNKYTPQQWERAPLMKQVAQRVLDEVGHGVMIGHNISFDASFLDEGIRRAGIDAKLPRTKVDTAALAFEHLVPLGLKSLSLDAIRDFLGWSREGAHTALKDAEDARRLFHLLRGGLSWRERVRLYRRHGRRPTL